MKSKLRIEFTLRELSSLVRVLSAHQGDELSVMKPLIIDKYLNAYIKSSKNAELGLAGFAALTGDPVMDMIIEVISALTGVPTSSITASSDLAQLGMTAFKKSQLRNHINSFIEANGGSNFISELEIQACETVQDVYELTLSNLP